MKKASAATLLLLLLAVTMTAIDLTAQKAKRAPSGKSKTTLSPCGVPVPSFEEFLEETKEEWRLVTSTKTEMYYYNTRKMPCVKGVFRVWIKMEKIGSNQTRAMSRYEVNCHTDKLRITSGVQYDKDGKVESSQSWRNPDWDEAIPETVGEGVVETICRKPICH